MGKTLAESRLREKYDANVVAIKRGEQIIVPPNPGEKIQAGDVLIVVGRNGGLQKLEELE
ncbi:TrkA-C domain protein [Thermosinus carboxydivorans Nor1]|uniref:TrkA-C domain protein n=1 Tax=Thermosinus carboxydivorans Nor1 TaxID=401526 RepID=A1HP83_9FIRM|nr:TrkA-C domain protein [Thermosinus carboxydivorans Nor1]